MLKSFEKDHPSEHFTAVVFVAPASLPAPGSVNPKEPNIFPDQFRHWVSDHPIPGQFLEIWKM